MLQSVKKANDLIEIIKSIEYRWSASIARQKKERITALIKAKTRQEERLETGDFTKKLRVNQNIRAIDVSINALDSAYSDLFNKFKQFKRNEKN